MPRLRIPELTEFERAALSGLPRQELEDLAWRFRELARTLANRLSEDSTTSSRPPSSDDPYRRGQRGGRGPVGQGREGGADQDAATPGREAQDKTDKDKAPAKPPGKRLGMPGHWRREPIVGSRETTHGPVGGEHRQGA